MSPKKKELPELPEKFQNEMRRILGEEEFEAYINSFASERVYGLRVNTLKISPEEFLKISPWPLRPIPWIENGFYYDETVKPAKHPYYFAGLYYLQEPSAMTPANLLPIEEGDRVLDLCAAPGGKTTELGARLKDTGLLVANDISASRAKALLKNIELFGIGNAYVTCEEPGRLTPSFSEFFDKILIDAPCSGEGMFRKEHKMIKAWEEHGPAFFHEIQKNILEQAYAMLRPGGMMLYSTCTFSSMEDEGSIQSLLNHHPDMHVIPCGNYEGFGKGQPELVENGSSELMNAIRIWPQRMEGEGHFIALLQKEGEASVTRGVRNVKDQKLSEECLDFLQKLHISQDDAHFELRKEYVNRVHNEMQGQKGIRFMRSGLFLGEIKKKRFEPSQALAMYLAENSCPDCISLPADDPRIMKYLRGETIDIPEADDKKGWQLLLVDGYPLGWGKLSGGSLKNKYLPGWRMM